MGLLLGHIGHIYQLSTLKVLESEFVPVMRIERATNHIPILRDGHVLPPRHYDVSIEPNYGGCTKFAVA